MDQNIAITPHRPVRRERGRYRDPALAGLAALVVLISGALGLAIESAINLAAAASRSETTAAESLPTYSYRDLPKELRGYPQAVQYEHMYRKDPAASPPSRWIR
jgi:hypothetical protein